MAQYSPSNYSTSSPLYRGGKVLASPSASRCQYIHTPRHFHLYKAETPRERQTDAPRHCSLSLLFRLGSKGEWTLEDGGHSMAGERQPRQSRFGGSGCQFRPTSRSMCVCLRSVGTNPSPPKSADWPFLEDSPCSSPRSSADVPGWLPPVDHWVWR